MEQELELEIESASSSGDDSPDSEIEVFPFQDSESDDAKALEDEPDYMRAWGNQKKLFYDGNQSSDGSDNENDLEQEDVDLAETRQSKIMKESDFQLHWLDLAQSPGKLSEPTVPSAEVPVLSEVVNSLQRCVAWLQKYATHSLKLRCSVTPEGTTYIQSKIHLMFCYCVNTLYYLQTTGITRRHPVVGKMTVLNEILSRVGKGDNLLSEAASLDLQDNLTMNSSEKPVMCGVPILSPAPCPLQYYQQQVKKKARVSTLQPQMLGCENPDLEAKRSITYQIARNKGLMPKRKKEQRNPRVKHRNKYTKALIKRKSQVLPVVHEVHKYGGESSGIRSRLARSVVVK